MSEIFELNLESLQKFRPDFLALLQPEIEKFRHSPGGDAQESYQWTESGDWVNLHYRRAADSQGPELNLILHEPNPQTEAERLIAQAKTERATMIMVFGAGLGHLFMEVLKRRSGFNFAIALVEANPQIFLRALCLHDYSKAFADPTIGIIVQRHPARLIAQLHGLFYHFTEADRVLHILGCPNVMRIDDAIYQHAHSRLGQIIDEVLFSHGNSVDDAFEGLRNIIDNIPRLLKNAGHLPERGKFSGLCLSVASGPSLNEHWQTLRDAQGKIPIIACDSALKKLLAEGIEPDWITALERMPEVAGYFRGVKIPARTSLIAPSLIMKDAFEAFEGHQIIYSSAGSWNLALGLHDLGSIYAGHSAGNLNLALARELGFDKTILVGHNLAFGLGTHESHYQGIGDARESHRSEAELFETGNKAKVPTQDGKGEVFTIAEYLLFKVEIENLIAENPERVWVNTALKGAKIEGAEALELPVAIQKYFSEPQDAHVSKSKIYESSNEILLKTRRDRVLANATTCAERIEHWHKESQATVKNIKNWKKKIEDAENSGRPLSIEQTLPMVESIQKLINDAYADPVFQRAAVSLLMPQKTLFHRKINEMIARTEDAYQSRKGFILAHTSYLEIWDHYLPMFAREYRRGAQLAK